LGEILAFKDPSSPRELITVHEDDSLHICLVVMISNKISSVPVLDATGRVVGVVDMTDICRMLVERLSEVEGWKTWPDFNVSELLDSIRICDGVDFSKGDPLLISNAAASVESIICPLSTGLSHYCVVRFDEGNEYGIISQVDIASWLASLSEEHSELFEKFSEVSLLGELRNRSSESHQVVQILWTESVFDILKLMLREKVHAVALVDAKGKLQGNFSTSDLMFIDAGSVCDIRLSGKEYLKKFSRCSLTPISFLDDENANLAESLMLFSGMGIHRIWLVCSPVCAKFAPTGLFTVTDVLKIAYDHFLC